METFVDCRWSGNLDHSCDFHPGFSSEDIEQVLLDVAFLFRTKSMFWFVSLFIQQTIKERWDSERNRPIRARLG